MSDFTIHPAVTEVASEIDELAAAVRRILECSPVWREGSIASSQIADEANFTGPSSPYPVKHALLTGVNALAMCADHLTALAGTLRTERTVYGPLALVRPVLSSSGMANYLLDRDLSTRERLRRSWAMHSAAYTEQLALSHRPGDDIERISSLRRQEIRDLAETAGFEVKHPAWKRIGRGATPAPPRWKVGDEGFPGEGSLIAATLADGEDGARLGWSIYRMTSMFVHAQPTTLTMMHIHEIGASEPGVANVILGTTLDRTLSFIAPAALSVRKASVGAIDLFGQNREWWADRLPAILLRWQRIINAHTAANVERFDIQPGDVARALGFSLAKLGDSNGPCD